MNETAVMYIKMSGAFLVPFLTTLGVGIDKFATAAPTNYYQVAGVIIASVAAGYVSLTSYLSRTYADHVDATGTNNVVAPTVTSTVKPQQPTIVNAQ